MTTKRPFGFVRYRKGRPSPYLAGFHPPGGGPEVTKAFATEEDADVWLAEHHVAAGRGVLLDARGPKTTLGQWWSAFIAERNLAPTARETYGPTLEESHRPGLRPSPTRQPAPGRDPGLGEPAPGRSPDGRDHPGGAAIGSESRHPR
jgi:hypothetical protein